MPARSAGRKAKRPSLPSLPQRGPDHMRRMRELRQTLREGGLSQSNDLSSDQTSQAVALPPPQCTTPRASMCSDILSSPSPVESSPPLKRLKSASSVVTRRSDWGIAPTPTERCDGQAVPLTVDYAADVAVVLSQYNYIKVLPGGPLSLEVDDEGPHLREKSLRISDSAAIVELPGPVGTQPGPSCISSCAGATLLGNEAAIPKATFIPKAAPIPKATAIPKTAAIPKATAIPKAAVTPKAAITPKAAATPKAPKAAAPAPGIMDVDLAAFSAIIPATFADEANCSAIQAAIHAAASDIAAKAAAAANAAIAAIAEIAAKALIAKDAAKSATDIAAIALPRTAPGAAPAALSADDAASVDRALLNTVSAAVENFSTASNHMVPDSLGTAAGPLDVILRAAVRAKDSVRMVPLPAIDISRPLSLPTCPWQVTNVTAELVVVNEPRIVVCIACQMIVPNPVRHVRDRHACRLPENFFDLCDLDRSWCPARDTTISPIPFIQVRDGFRCKECKHCFLKEIACNCSTLKSVPKGELTEANVNVQRILGQGTHKYAIAVTDAVGPEPDSHAVRLAAVLAANTPALETLTPASFREMNKFYRMLNWFVKKEELDAVKNERLLRYFERPEQASVLFETELQTHFVETFMWAQGGISPGVTANGAEHPALIPDAFRALVGYRNVIGSTIMEYSRKFKKIIWFVINLSNTPIRAPFVLECPAPLKNLVASLLQTLDKLSLFSVVEFLISQKITVGQLTIIEAIVRLHCVGANFCLKDPADVQPFMSRIMKLSRLAVLVMAGILSDALPARYATLLDEGDVDIQDDETELGDDDEILVLDEAGNWTPTAADDSEEIATGYRCQADMAEEICRRVKFLDAKQLYPIQVVVDIKAKAMKFGRPPEARITATADPYVITYNLKRLDLRELSRKLEEIFDSAQGYLAVLSMGADTELDMDEVDEDMRNVAIKHRRGDAVSQRLLAHVLTNPELTARAVVGTMATNALIFREDFHKGYLKVHNQLEECLTLLIHLVGGLPGRSTELETLRFTKVAEKERHVFLFLGQILIEPTFNKTEWSMNDLKQYRFLSKELTRLVLTNFFFVRPFVHAIARTHIPGYAGDYLTHLFVWQGKRMRGDLIRATIVSLIADKFNVSFAEYRQTARFQYNRVASGTGGGLDRDSLLMLANLAACETQGHGLKTGSEHYGKEKGGHPKFNPVQFAAHLGVCNRYSKMIVSMHLPKERQSPRELFVEHEEVLAPKLGLNSRSVARTTHARPNQRLVSLTPFPVEPVLGSDDTVNLESLSVGDPRPLAALNHRLAAALGWDAVAWKSPEQLQAVKMAALTSENFIYVAPTGCGKSSSFLLTAMFAVDSVTIVLANTKALRDEIQVKAETAGIPVKVWKADEEPVSVSQGLIVATYEKIRSKSARMLLLDLSHKGTLRRIFFDEAHTLVTQSFRDPLSIFPHLTTLAPFALLTATGSPRVMKALEGIFFRDSPAEIIRSPSTDRPELSYSVSRFSTHKESTAWASRLRHEVQKLSSSDLCIVFVSTVPEVMQVVNEMMKSTVAVGYHASLDEDQQAESLRLWRSGQAQMMVATSAFAAGIDTPRVRTVVMLGFPYSIEDLVQMCGRAGRDGKNATALLFFSEADESERLRFFKDLAFRNLKDVARFAAWTGCLREFLNLSIDARRVHCLDSHEMALCDRCEMLVREPLDRAQKIALDAIEHAAPRLRPAPEMQLSTRNYDMQLTVMQAFVAKYPSGCAFCYLNGTVCDHSIQDCPSLNHSFKACGRCFNLGHPAIPVHLYVQCPFQMPDLKGVCAGCWHPTAVKGVEYHIFAWSCKRLSIKLCWIQRHSVLLDTVSLLKQFERAGSIAQPEVKSVRAVSWFCDNFLRESLDRPFG